LIKDAAKYKFDIAQYMLGIMYRNGEGITKNYGNAVKYLWLAVNQGNVPAMMDLGTIYAEGVIYPQNYFMAHVLFNIASVYDAPNAETYRDEIEEYLKIENLLQAQTKAETFSEQPSELTLYIRKTYGNDVRVYIDEIIKKRKKVKKKHDK
jgi:TPR repeat protein